MRSLPAKEKALYGHIFNHVVASSIILQAMEERHAFTVSNVMYLVHMLNQQWFVSDTIMEPSCQRTILKHHFVEWISRHGQCPPQYRTLPTILLDPVQLIQSSSVLHSLHLDFLATVPPIGEFNQNFGHAIIQTAPLSRNISH
ncbi:hypothetical protein MVEN_00907900 [Mycena venus]|uniref:Uncharacterized protein n=1 Tax=Mycena venus TaxID=2733690 RepID=A0A8H7D200_9AGAR|nr:hypothetical protein MVEN_00907900 [Mycena venus]